MKAAGEPQARRQRAAVAAARDVKADLTEPTAQKCHGAYRQAEAGADPFVGGRLNPQDSAWEWAEQGALEWRYRAAWRRGPETPVAGEWLSLDQWADAVDEMKEWVYPFQARQEWLPAVQQRAFPQLLLP